MPLWTAKSWLAFILGLVVFAVLYTRFSGDAYRRLATSYRELETAGEGYSKLPRFRQTSPDKHWLTMEPYARLGNNLFEYAALLGLARRNGRYAFVPLGSFEELIDMFELTLPIHDVPSFLEWTRVWDPMENHTRTYLTTNRLPSTNVTLGGSFQSFIYFYEIRQEVRREFVFRRWLREKVKRQLARMVPPKWNGDPELVRVGVHIRRSDLISDEYKSKGFYFPDESYFKNAMNYFEQRHDKVVFIVGSDDIPFCKEFFSNFTQEIIFSEEQPALVDMAILSSCDHTIVTIGTYSWWVGWLNRGTTLYMEDFPPEDTWAAGIYKKEYFIPPNDEYNNWIGISQDVLPDV